jgi:hypothetical protein
MERWKSKKNHKYRYSRDTCKNRTQACDLCEKASHGRSANAVRLKISVVSTPLKWLRLAVYWIARFRHDFQPEERL